MKRKWLLLLALACCVMLAAGILAACHKLPAEQPDANLPTPSEGLEYGLNNDGQSYEVTGIGECEDTALVIPQTYNGLPVTSIGAGAFENCTGLISVTIPDSVTSIEENAFRGCSSIERMTIPFGEMYLGYIFGASHPTYNDEYVPTSLKEVVITGGASIAGSAFYGCSGLTSVIIPDSIVSIGNSAFASCGGLISFAIGNGVTTVGDYAFAMCTSLTFVTIPDSVVRIGQQAFAGCDGIIDIVGGVSYVDGWVVDASSDITTASLQKGTRGIAEGGVFADRSSLTSVTIPDGVRYIGASAFDGCNSLTSITIPDSVITIGDSAFDGCKNLQYNEYDNALYLGNEKNPYVVLIRAKDTSITSVDIHDATKIIYEDAFYDRRGLRSITVPDSVTSIGERAFRYCTGLTSIIIGNGVTSIGEETFLGCIGLTSIVIPDSVMSIGEYAFAGCTSSTSVTIGNGVTSIGEGAFGMCSALTSVTIPDSVTSIGSYAFYNCGGLTSVNIPESVTSIGSGAFGGCNKLQYNEYGNALYLGNEKNPYVVLIKAKDTSITSVDIPDSTKLIYEDAFSYCDSLISVTIGNGVTSIGEYAFYNCGGLTSVNIPDSVTSIGDSAFQDCYRLKTVTFEGTVAEWSAITKGYAWNYYSPFTEVVCSNGTVSV